ncbi:MAG: chemotaxis protein CheW, partial [Pseudomonadota bacterium]
RRFALMVDELVGKQHVVIKSLDAILKDTYGIAGSAIMPDGTVGLIVDIESIAKTLNSHINTMVAA